MAPATVLAMWLAAAVPGDAPAPATPAQLTALSEGLQGDFPGITPAQLKGFRVKSSGAESADACGRVDAERNTGGHVIRMQMFLDAQRVWHAYAFSADDASNRESCEALGM